MPKTTKAGGGNNNEILFRAALFVVRLAFLRQVFNRLGRLEFLWAGSTQKQMLGFSAETAKRATPIVWPRLRCTQGGAGAVGATYENHALSCKTRPAKLARNSDVRTCWVHPGFAPRKALSNSESSIKPATETHELGSMELCSP